MSVLNESVLAFHGFFGTGEDFHALRCALQSLYGKDLGWSAPDLPGHGKTPILRTLPWESAFQEHYKPQPRVILGYSMGGRWALEYALRYPEATAALILISSSAGIANPLERTKRLEQDRARANELREKGTSSFWAAWKQQPLIASQERNMAPEAFAQLEKRRCAQDSEALAWALEELSQGKWPERWKELRRLTAPVLLVHGTQDMLYKSSMQQMAEIVPQARLIEIENAGHAAHLENPLQCARAIFEFLQLL